jgi:transposase
MPKRSEKRVRRIHSDEFCRNAVSMVDDQGYTVARASRELGINQSLLRTWRQKYDRSAEFGLSESDREELDRLRKEVGRLRMERDILKKRRPSSRTKRTEISVHRTAPRRMADHDSV